MKSLRKLIASLAAATMVLANVASVSATTYYTGIHFTERFNDWAAGTDIPGSTSGTRYDYIDRSGTNFRVYIANGDVRINEGHVVSGTRALRVRGTGSAASDGKGAARIRFNIPAESSNRKVKVSFKSCNDSANGDWNGYDYATVGDINWNSTARLKDGSSMWTRTYLGTPSTLGGKGEADDYWYRYEATFTAPEDTVRLDFAAFKDSYFIIDDIVITDEDGNLIFSENFERDTVSSTLTTRWTYNGTADACTYRIISDTVSSSTNHGLEIYSNNQGTTYLSIEVPAVEDNKYYLTYDIKAHSTGLTNAIALDFAGNDVYGSGRVSSTAGTGYTKTINSGGNTTFKISATAYGKAVIDNIVLKDKYDRIVLYEDFEEHDREFSTPIIKIGTNGKYTINETGTATITATAANNKEDSAFSVYLIAAVYDSTGKNFVRLASDNATLSKNTRKNFSVSVSVTNGQKLRLFWWDSLTGNIKPVKDFDGTSIKRRSY